MGQLIQGSFRDNPDNNPIDRRTIVEVASALRGGLDKSDETQADFEKAVLEVSNNPRLQTIPEIYDALHLAVHNKTYNGEEVTDPRFNGIVLNEVRAKATEVLSLMEQAMAQTGYPVDKVMNAFNNKLPLE